MANSTTAKPISTTPKKPNDRFHSTHHLRGRLRHTSPQHYECVKRAAFGFTNFNNYRIRALLYAGKPNWTLLDTLTPP